MRTNGFHERYCSTANEVRHMTKGRTCFIDRIDPPEGHFGATAEVFTVSDTACFIAAENEAAVRAIAREAGVEIV